MLTGYQYLAVMSLSFRAMLEIYVKGAYLSGQQLALGNQRFPVRVPLLAMCRGELSVVIAWLMSKSL